MHPYYFDPPPEENTGEVSPAVRPAPQEPPGRREGERQPAAHAGPAVRPTRRKSERGAALVLAALTLVLGGTAVLLALRAQPLVDAGAFYPSGGGQASVTPSLSFQAELERAPTGDGTVLSLEAKPEGEGMRLQDIYRKVIPSIVSIQATVAKGTLQGVSQGTGILMSGDGYLITNAHVIDGAFRVDVSLEDGRGFQAKLVGSDSTTDLAVLKIEAEGLTPAAFGDSEDMVVGDAVVAIGNPMGEELRGTMTDGILSAINRDMEVDGNPMTLLQTTAALNTGNSGGALVNDQGQVIGITNMKLVSTDADSNTLEGLGFAIPTATVKPVVDSLIQWPRHRTAHPGRHGAGALPLREGGQGSGLRPAGGCRPGWFGRRGQGAGGGYPPHRQRHRAEHHRRSAGRPGRLGRGREHPLPGGPGGSLPGVLRPAGGAV